MPIFRQSYHRPPSDDRLGDVDLAAHVQLTVVLKPGAPLDAAIHGGGPGISRETYRALHATPDYVVERVCGLARRFGLTVVRADGAAHVVRLAGTYEQALALFPSERIGVYAGARGRRYVARTGRIDVPAEIAGDVVAVMGLDQRPVARAHFRPSVSAGGVSYTPLEVAGAYGFPSGWDGTGQVVALIELGGGYSDGDLAAYFAGLGIVRSGSVVAVGVNGAGNAPDGNPGGADGEVQLDIEVLGAVAPAADIAVYFAPNEGSGFHDAISAAVGDTARRVSVMSISWGGAEASWSQQDIDAIDQVLAQAATLGITVCVASGDGGSSDGVSDGQPHVDFPASSPNVLACGGTSLPAGGGEVAWDDGVRGGGSSGGGYSGVFGVPAWQAGVVTGSGRGVPDVSGNADPATGYQVSIDGTLTVIGGTSAVAPLWAGLVARVNQALGRPVGFINPVLYGSAGVCTDIVAGGNGAYQAGVGWDAVTGLGSPLGGGVLAALSAGGGAAA